MNARGDPDEIRLRYRYRDLILRGKVRMPLETARRLVGPDCAYHLYRTVPPTCAPDEHEPAPAAADDDQHD